MQSKYGTVSFWFISVISLIVAMVCVGGITRLTGSGLSITEWKPIMGAIPPLDSLEWADAFEKYKKIPQFQLLNSTMDLGGFKFIFFWEYFHRLLGRLLGLVVLLPGLYFIAKKNLDSLNSSRVLVGFALGGAQGFLGWFMVKSGFSELVYVSHLRLAAHLMLALLILAYWWWIFLRWRDPDQRKSETAPLGKISILFWSVAILLFVQLTYGALVAGLKAGVGYNTFPLMNDQWVPTSFFAMSPGWVNVFNNPASVQFLHRWLALVLIVFAVILFKKAKKLEPSPSARKSGHLFMALLGVQFVLGVLALLYQVPLVLGSLHQLNGCLLVLVLTSWGYHLQTPKT